MHIFTGFKNYWNCFVLIQWEKGAEKGFQTEKFTKSAVIHVMMNEEAHLVNPIS